MRNKRVSLQLLALSCVLATPAFAQSQSGPAATGPTTSGPVPAPAPHATRSPSQSTAPGAGSAAKAQQPDAP